MAAGLLSIDLTLLDKALVPVNRSVDGDPV